MVKTKLLVFHPALAPYRIDSFNKFFRYFDTSFYFSLDNLKEQKFDQRLLREETLFKFNLLKSRFEINGRLFHGDIYKVIKKNKPEIIFCSEYSPTTLSVVLYKLLFNRSIKVYIISDDSIHYAIERKGLRKWIPYMTSYVIDGIIFPSNIVSKWYIQNINSKTKTFELPIIHSNEIFRAKLSMSLDVAKSNIVKYNLNGKKVYLFVGRLVKAKNVETLLEAFAKTRKDSKILFIIGDGESFELLKNLSQQLNLIDSCIFLGRLEGKELMAWYNIAQCLILPSYREAYGAVVNEALLAGCRVLCSSYAGASVLINKKNGHVFNPNNTKQLSLFIEKVSEDINSLKLPIELKADLMPFTLDEKLEILFSRL